MLNKHTAISISNFYTNLILKYDFVVEATLSAYNTYWEHFKYIVFHAKEVQMKMCKKKKFAMTFLRKCQLMYFKSHKRTLGANVKQSLNKSTSFITNVLLVENGIYSTNNTKLTLKSINFVAKGINCLWFLHFRPFNTKTLFE